MLFRVHFSDGTTRDVDAASANAARDEARLAKGGGEYAGTVSKIKVIRTEKT